MKFDVLVNDRPYAVDAPNDEPLLWVLRDDLGLTGTKPGCGEGLCGLCTVLIDERPAHACQVLARDTVGRDIRTVEGLATVGPNGHESLRRLLAPEARAESRRRWRRSAANASLAIHLVRHGKGQVRPLLRAEGRAGVGCAHRARSGVR